MLSSSSMATPFLLVRLLLLISWHGSNALDPEDYLIAPIDESEPQQMRGGNPVDWDDVDASSDDSFGQKRDSGSHVRAIQFAADGEPSSFGYGASWLIKQFLEQIFISTIARADPGTANAVS